MIGLKSRTLDSKSFNFLEGLWPGDYYEGTIESYNKFGWSLHSEVFNFTSETGIILKKVFKKFRIT